MSRRKLHASADVASRSQLLLSRLGQSVAMLLLLAAAPGPAQTHATITSREAQTVRGWGMSLAWEANVLYGSPLHRARVTDPAARERFMDLLFGDPAHGPGLGLNVARYNIGGGGKPSDEGCVRKDKAGLLPAARMEGFLTGPHGVYDWSRDASQRRMLREARARGANLFEAFSNSAPWWMTVSGCVSGAERAGEDNLRTDAFPAFTRYLTQVVRHFRRHEGIAFASVSPLNEPDGTWWVAGNRQEGSFASLSLQERVVTSLARDLTGTGIVVSGTETNNLDAMTGYLTHMDAASLAALGRINVHQYSGSNPGALHRVAAALNKPVWASEVGCCMSADRPEMSGALRMADAIRSALRDLHAEVWCFWQADWGVIDIDSGHPIAKKQFYTIAQFTRFIRPGFTVLTSEGDNTLAALSADRRRLVLVAVNRSGADELEDFDLREIHRPGATVAVYRTTADPSVNLARAASRVNEAGYLIDRQPPSSVTTYVIDGEPVATHRR